MALKVISKREASIFACAADVICRPGDDFPAVAETTAVAFYDKYLLHSPAVNRAVIRTLFIAFELLPLVLGFGKRMRRLDAQGRHAVLDRLSQNRASAVIAALKIVKSIVNTSYYSDDRVLAICGYDPEVVVDRGRKLRLEEARP